MIPLQPAPAGLPSRSFGGPRRGGPAASSRLRWLLAAPHRLGFFGGALMLGLSALWWGAMLAARFGGVAVPWAVVPGTAHALLMGFGFMPMFFVGFLFTAGPRWLGVAPLPVRSIAPGVGLMLADSRADDRDHARLVLAALGIGTAALWAAALAVTLRADAAARAAVWVALWGCFGLVFVAAAHRMIPFFSAAALPGDAAWRPRAVLIALAAFVAVQVPFAAAEALGAFSPALAFMHGAIEWLGALLLFWLSLRWGLRQSLSIRLLAMLHLGFFWLAVSFALGGVSHLLQAFSGGSLSLGLAPVHAFTMGYLGSTMLAMATRVACGQHGRAVAADRWAWVMFWVLQAGVVARVFAALWPVAGTHLTLLAAQCWLAAVGAWAVRTGRWMLRP